MADRGDLNAAGWRRDPTGRFFSRYWDGSQYTDRVVTKKRQQTTDPYTPAPESSTTDAKPGPASSRSPESRPTPAMPAPTSSTKVGRTWKTWQVLVIGFVALIVGMAAGAGTAEKDQTVSAFDVDASATTRATLSEVQVIPPAPTPAPTVAATPAPTVAATTTAPGPKIEFGAGTHRVGVDIAPGTCVASGGASCYWERQSVFGGGGADAIIANEFAPNRGQVVVTIQASDKGFRTSGCGTWKRG